MKVDQNLKPLVILFLVFNFSLAYDVEVTRLTEEPLLSYEKKQSIFEFNYNPSYVPIMINGVHVADGLLVRSHHPDIKSNFAFVMSSNDSFFELSTDINLHSISQENIVFSPETSYETYAVEDPRISYNHNDMTYYMFYSACEKLPNGVISRLALATTKSPWIKESWTRHGILVENWSKSGAIIFSESKDDYNYLYWGDNHIQCWKSKNLTDYNSYVDCGEFIKTRSDNKDSNLVESGPAPIKLSDGNYFFIYNSARTGVHSKERKDWDMEYNAFWVIIDGKNKEKIIYRADKPMLTPALPWEKDIPGLLAPNVVFIEAAKDLGNDKILIFFGEGDKYVGAAIVHVKVDLNSFEQDKNKTFLS